MEIILGISTTKWWFSLEATRKLIGSDNFPLVFSFQRFINSGAGSFNQQEKKVCDIVTRLFSFKKSNLSFQVDATKL